MGQCLVGPLGFCCFSFTSGVVHTDSSVLQGAACTFCMVYHHVYCHQHRLHSQLVALCVTRMPPPASSISAGFAPYA